jgi:hypothetical protein
VVAKGHFGFDKVVDGDVVRLVPMPLKWQSLSKCRI